MTDIYANIGTATIASRGFIPLAVEAGVTVTIKSLISGLAVDAKTLLFTLKGALAGSNTPLAAALNMDNLAGIIAYMERAGDGIMAASGLPSCALPPLLDMDGPANVSAGRDTGDVTQINIGYSARPEGFNAEIYLDGVFMKTSDLEPTGATVWDILPGVANDGQPHTARVLYINDAGEQTRFGPIASFS